MIRTFFLSDKNLHNLEQTVNNELQKIDIWMKANQLSVNYNKTKCMLITSQYCRSDLKSFHVKMGNHELEQTDQIKYLGLHIDNNGSLI